MKKLIFSIFLLIFSGGAWFCMAESEEAEQKDSMIREQLQGKVAGVSLFSVNFWALGEDRSWLNSLLEQNVKVGQKLELVKTEVFYSNHVSQDYIQRAIAESFIEILNLEEGSVLSKNKSQTTDTAEKTGSSSTASYVENAILVDRKLDPSALSRGFLASIGGDYDVDILFTGSVTVESCLMLDTSASDTKKYYLAFQILPLVKIMNPLNGEVLDLNEFLEEGLTIQSALVEISEESLVQKSAITEILLERLRHTMGFYYPLLSPDFTK